MLNYTIIKPASREEWLEHRKHGIGSSEVGIIAGVSRFMTPIELWRKKMGLVAPEPENEAMRAGHEYEAVVAFMYGLRTGDVMDEDSVGDWLAVDNDKSFLRVSPDRIFWEKDIPEDMRSYANAYILECKTTKKDVTKTNYPRSWYFQVQYQMGVMGLKKAVIAWWSSYGLMHFDYVTVPFNKVVYGEIVKMLTQFWNKNIIGGVMPDTVLSNEDASLRWPTANEGSSVTASDELMSVIKDYNALNDKASEIKEQLDGIKLKVRTFMKDADELKDADGKTIATWKSAKAPDSFDKDRFSAEHPDLYQSYMKTNQTARRLTFKKQSARS